MVIKQLILQGYNRFFLSNIEKLDYRPHNTIQMIASRNSAGKSSLLRQLNPLPVDMKKDFKEDGYKYIEIEHNNNIYKLYSSTKNSFICNDVELNPGGTKKVQLDLVKEHFNITPQIMDVLYNSNNFTNMSPSERKYWFTEMSNIDYKYPISVYNTIRSKHRDILGYIKLLNDDIIQSKLNILDSKQLEKYKQDRNILEEYISYLTSQYDNTVRTDNNQYIRDNIKSLTTTLYNILDRDLIKKDVKILEKELATKIGILNLINNNIDKTKKDIDSLDKLKDSSLDLGNLNKQLEKHKQDLNKISNSIYIDIEHKNIRNINVLFNNNHTLLLSFIDLLEEYKDVKKYNQEHINKFINYKNKLESDIRSYKANIHIIQSEIDHMVKHKEDNISCPNCNHSFNLIYNEDKYKLLFNNLTNYNKQLETTNKQYTDLNNLLNKISSFKIEYDKFLKELYSNSKLIPIWDYMFKTLDIISVNSNEMLSFINKLSKDLEYWSDVDYIEKEIEIISNKISNIEYLNKNYKNMNTNLLNNLLKDLEEFTISKNKLSLEIEKLNKDISNINSITELRQDLLNNILRYKRNIDYKVKSEYNNYLLKVIELLKSELIKIETIIKDNDNISNSINRNIKLLEENKKKEKVLSIAMKILSPDEGLIAKSINDFISTIVNDMNKIINSIWTYDLEILPCGVDEDNDLDYKFKVRINNDFIVDDISKLSSSGKEIVDLAFRLVLVRYKGLIDIPLYLDEFGNTFDQAHRSSAYSVIDKIVSSEYKQIFIVCHYSSIYSSLKNIDFNVLDPNNIELDTSININEILQIKRYI